MFRPPIRRARRPLAALAVAGLAAGAAGCGPSPETASSAADPRPGGTPSEQPATATADARAYVGGAVCADCHPEEAARWQVSQHDLALQTAAAATVLGDFGGAELVHGGITSSFFLRDGAPFIRTDGPDGQLADFEVAYTIGVDPLQQYVVQLDGGRYQIPSLAWDTRPAAEGGQRWFHLYPGERIASGDPLHWTGTYQRWNTMCAECHSTDLHKNYDPETGTFATTFASIDVDCEACHGPGSEHAADPGTAPPAAAGGARNWVFTDGSAIASLETRAQPAPETEVCAPCHSRRERLTDEHAAGDALLDGFRPALLDAGLYHADGQIDGEVYVYGSFVQSAMAAAGVGCNDCHEPHDLTLRAEGNALCGQCHLASTFDAPAHHRHEPGSPGAECVACHMRAKTYMIVDPRRDHSFRVPRPDLSARFGTPNACNDCHSDRSPGWAAARVAEWYPDGRRNAFHFGEALAAGRTWAADSQALLARLVVERDQPAIARATALALAAETRHPRLLELARPSLDDPDPLVRLAALGALERVPPALRADAGQRFLTDPLRALRTAAARALLAARAELGPGRQRDLDAALAEYLETQTFNSDRGEGLLNSAGIAAALGRPGDAEHDLLTAIEREPHFTPAYVNLADLYRELGREPDAERVLREGLAIAPEDGGLNYALALWLVRAGRLGDALERFDAAAAAEPGSPRYAYALGIALNSADAKARAIAVLEAAHERFPGHPDILFGLATMLRDAGRRDEARALAEELTRLAPADRAARALLAELDAGGAR